MTQTPVAGEVPSDEELRGMYEAIEVIAVVGASTNPEKPAHRIPAYLQSQGYRIVPVNQNVDEIFGEKTYPSLADVDVKIDAVDVFRPSEEAADIARQAVETDAQVLWLQPGIESPEAQRIVTAAGMRFISGICMGTTHARLDL